jgi:hypothetical protein
MVKFHLLPVSCQYHVSPFVELYRSCRAEISTGGMLRTAPMVHLNRTNCQSFHFEKHRALTYQFNASKEKRRIQDQIRRILDAARSIDECNALFLKISPLVHL